ncbi:hypothetical protein DL93DRAFT_2156950, partial [Clavulina sp. PMI_390]
MSSLAPVDASVPSIPVISFFDDINYVLGGLLTGTILSSVPLNVIPSRFAPSIIQTAQVSLYFDLVTAPQNLTVFLVGSWTNSYFAIHTVVSSFIVQLFFLFRLWTLSRSILTVSLVLSVVLAQFAFGIVFSVQTFLAHFTSLQQFQSTAIITWLALAAASDTLIAGALTFILRRHRTGFQATDSTIHVIIAYGITTGAVTSILAIILLFCFAVAKRWETPFVIGMPLGGVYIVVLLITLQSRVSLRERLTRDGPRGMSVSVELTSRSVSNGYSHRRAGSLAPKGRFSIDNRNDVIPELPIPRHGPVIQVKVTQSQMSDRHSRY